VGYRPADQELGLAETRLCHREEMMSGLPVTGVTLRQIRAFIAVAKIGSFTRAADTIGLSQPALTACIRQLEDQLGVPLFDRTTRHVELTMFGSDFLPSAERIVRELDSAMMSLKAIGAGQSGRVSMASIGSIASSLLPRALASFKEKYPLVGVDVSEDHSEGVRRKVLESEAEFGLSGMTEPVPDVEAIPFFSDPIGLFCREDHPLAALERPLRWSDLSGLEILNMGHEAQIRSVAEHAPDVAILLSSTTYKVRNPHALVALLQQGNAIAAMPRLSIPDNKQEGWIFRTLSSPTLNREIFLCRHRRTTLSPSAKGLIAAIRDSAEVAGATLVESIELA
jgi:LysR family transcriptional regulator, carnitine catabolism transcriptional activator